MPISELETDNGLSALAELFYQAIAQKTCVSATYNKTAMKLAPHIVYTKHGDQFVDAVMVEQDGKKPKLIKLGTFKLAGLSGVAPTNRLFVAQRSFNPADPKYADTQACVAQPVAKPAAQP